MFQRLPARSSHHAVLASLAFLFSVDALAAITSLEEAVAAAKKNSPDIQALRSQVESAHAKKRLTLAPSEPNFSITYNDLDKAFNVPNSASTVYQVSQPIAFPGKAFVNHGAAAHTAKSVESQLRATELQVVTNVRTAYYGLALARKSIQINAEQKASYERILAIAKRRYEAGSITQVDFLNAQISVYSTENDLVDLQTTERAALAQLNILMGESADKAIEVEPLRSSMELRKLPTRTEAEAKMLQQRPELNAVRETAEAARATSTLSKMAYLPDMQLVLGATNYNLPAASPLSSTNPATQTYMAGVQFTIPLWGLFNERESAVAASHDRAAADAQVTILNNQSRVALESALQTLKALGSKIKNYEEHLVPLSEQSFNIALVSYSSGKIDFQSLADTATARRNIKKDYFTILSSYLTNYSSFGQLLGEEL